MNDALYIGLNENFISKDGSARQLLSSILANFVSANVFFENKTVRSFEYMYMKYLSCESQNKHKYSMIQRIYFVIN